MILESEIKSIFLNKLIVSKRINFESVVVSEFSIDKYSKRADLMVINEDLFFAVEIKSEADSLIRLDSQLDKYQQYFDKVILVVAEKHLCKVMEKVGSNIEVWSISAKSNLKQVQRGKRNQRGDVKKYFDLLSKREVEKFFSLHGFRLQSESRSDLFKSMDGYLNVIKRADVRSYLFKCLRLKYQFTSQRFLRKVKETDVVHENYMSLLSSSYREADEIKNPGYLLNVLGSIDG